MKQYIDLHVHSQDLFDSDNKPGELCKKFKSMGAPGFALTQHGVLSGIDAVMDAAAENELKVIPGIEAYVGHSHLIILSKDYEGYQALVKAVSESQTEDGKTDMSEEVLARYFGPDAKGHDKVIATSACIGGILANVLRSNEQLDHEIAKLERKRAKYDGALALVGQLQEIVDDKDAEIAEMTEQKNALAQAAGVRFGKRRQFVDKLIRNNDPAAEAEEVRLQADMEAAQEAEEALAEVKAELATLKKQRTAANKTLTDAKYKADREEQCLFEIEQLESRKDEPERLYARACDMARRMVAIFGKGNFYVELQNHGIPAEAEIYPVLAKIAQELHIPVVASNDVHILDNSKQELLKRNILKSMRPGMSWQDLQPGDDQLYIKTDEEMVEWLGRIFPQDVVMEALENTKVIFDQCEVAFPQEEHYPVFPSINGRSSRGMFLDAVREGAAWRFPEGLSQEYKDRINYEYKIMTDMGYEDYHMIVKDFLEYGRALSCVPEDRLEEAPLDIASLKAWTKANGWTGGFMIGPGRGSAVGSLICYCLGITSLDPIKYGLLFERFLNPERVSMPDIDSDIGKRIRYKVIRYLENKYGKESVCGIMTTNAQAPKGAIRICAKAYGEATGRPGAFLSLGDEMAKKVPNDPGISFRSEISEDGNTVIRYLQEAYRDNPDARQILAWATVIEGCFTAYGAHAAGIVIADGKPVSDYVPLRWNRKLQEMTTQVDMLHLEEKGLLKMDLLGLRTLDIITDCLRLIKETTGKEIDPLKDIPMDDPQVFYEIFQKGRTGSVFQFESEGMRNMLKRFKPACFEDLIILVSMFRPGPLQFIDDVIDVKNGAEERYLTPELKPILGKTYGAIVYQEQVMEIFQKLAGYTLGGADNVRRFMSKKKMDKLAHEKEAFIYGDPERGIKGCVANGINETAAAQLFTQMSEFAKYAFNKSHAAAYAANSWYTAWLKYHYPAQFFAAALNWAQDSDGIAALMGEAALFRIPVLVPDINLSDTTFTVTADNSVRFGLSAVKTVGSNAADIIAERNRGGKFLDLFDFFTRTKVKKNAVENLIHAGAFDAFSKNRAAILSVVESFQDEAAKLKKKEKQIEEIREERNLATTKAEEEKQSKRLENAKRSYQDILEKIRNIRIPEEMQEDIGEKMAKELEFLGAYVTMHPLDEYRSAQDLGCSELRDFNEESDRAFGVITAVRFYQKNPQKPMAFLTVSDKTGSITVNVFTETYKRAKHLLKVGAVLLFIGKTSKRYTSYTNEDGDVVETISLTANMIQPVSKGRADILMNVPTDEMSDVVHQLQQNAGSVNGAQLLVQDFSQPGRCYRSNIRVDANSPLVSGACEVTRTNGKKLGEVNLK